MENLDIDKVLNMLNNPAVGKNSADIMSMLTEFNNVLATLQKTMGMLDSMGFKELIVRAAGVKLGVDPETPLKSSQGIIAQSRYHKEVLAHMNSLSEEQLGKMLSMMVSEEAKAIIEESELAEPEDEISD